MTITQLFCLLACAGHLVLWRCDRNLTYLAALISAVCRTTTASLPSWAGRR